MIQIFNLTDPLHSKQSIKTTDGVWISAESTGDPHKGFTHVVRDYAEYLPEGEHLLAAISLPTRPSASDKPMLRLVRVVRKAARVETILVEGASL